MNSFREEHNLVSMIDRILKCETTLWSTIKDEFKEHSIKTVISWWNDFKSNDFKEFNRDMRGKWFKSFDEQIPNKSEFEQKYTYVHVDHLRDDQYIEYRKNSLCKTGI